MASSVAAMSSMAGTSALSSPSSGHPSSSPCYQAVFLRTTETSFRLASLQGFGSSLSTVRRKGSSRIRAAAPPDQAPSDAQKQVQEFLEDLKTKYDSLENKTTVWVYGGGALVALWLSSSILGAINTLPLLPKLLEFIGICYTGWFVYRYLLFKSSRKQLAADIEDLKLKITGNPRGPSFFPDDEDSM